MQDANARFWSKVDRTDGCWLWHGWKTADGYGRFDIGDRKVLAHRFAYESNVGPIPDGLVLDHLCRVRDCVNPAHLEAVTVAENNRRGFGPVQAFALRTHCAEGHPLGPATPGKRRVCRPCANERNRRYKARLRALRAS